MAKIKSRGEKFPLPEPAVRPVGIIFFIALHVVGLIGAPLYIIYHGVSRAEWILFASYVFLTNMAITLGYHRLFAHRAFKAHWLIRLPLLFFGAATFEQSGLKWASQHRQHHEFTDSELDPYNIKQGFWHAHVGWILLWKHRPNYDNVSDLQKSKLVMHQHRWYTMWSLVAGIFVPLLIGFAIGKFWGVLIMTVALRLVLVLNSAFFVNSFCHTFGDNSFDHTISAKDHWFGALLTNGEGYHGFHHRFPSDYRNGVQWYDWDPTKWIIFILSKIRLTWDLKRTPREQIREVHPAAFTA